MLILECSSKGDRRFSAFFALIKDKSIETWYQSVKFKNNGTPCRKGEKVDYIVLKGKKLSPSYLTAWYRLLWLQYLTDNPELVEYAKQFDEFNDMFRGKSVNCQADCVRAFVKNDIEFFKPALELKEMLTLY